jgi:hypothetical protein
MLSISHNSAHKLEVNCGQWSEVIVSGTPKQLIEVKTNGGTHALAEISERGTASSIWMCDQ